MTLVSKLAGLNPFALRARWRATQLRLQTLEKRSKDLELFVDILLSDREHPDTCELGMHAQPGRRAIVAELFERLALKQAVETGTYLGNTTNYLARTFHVPVFSSELVPRHHFAARRMLRNVPNVALYLKDSREFLRELAADPRVTGLDTFFYLDAHWYDDLPLADELDIISSHWRQFAVLIDDFRVPGDPGYAYDDYGPGKCLDIEYLAPVLRRNGLEVFFPTIPSSSELGGRSGYAVAVRSDSASLLRNVSLLRCHDSA